ncbi:unnamed protein product [Caenorhabditis sp. 36 PRJEB53466]|nr:unnamed protein product [Caenorhabditis sp. 36 PRJEB53466]
MLLLLLFLLQIAPTLQEPRNLLQEFLKSHVDFSIHPCDDFYSHVCPATKQRDFVTSLGNIKKALIAENQKFYFGNEDVNMTKSKERASLLDEFMDSKEAINFNQSHPDLHQKLVDLFPMTIDFASGFHLKRSKDRYLNLRNMYIGLWLETISNIEMPVADREIRVLYDELKGAVRDEFMNTPWLINKNGSLEKFVKALDALPLKTVADFQEFSLETMVFFTRGIQDIRASLTLPDVHANVLEAIHEAIVLSDLLEYFKEKQYEILPELGNLKSKMEFIGGFGSEIAFNYILLTGVTTPVLLAYKTDFKSDLYGGVGTTLIHEIMHTFVFGRNDPSPLRVWGSNRTDCVRYQMKKTCRTFPTSVCSDATYTFEEDAADLAAYRIAWKSYEKTLSRESREVEEYERLDKKQLFFYAFPTLFCQKMNSVEGVEDTHSSHHHRINSLMSQMKAFKEVFQCKPNDRMMRNRSKHCVLFGEHAPQTKTHVVGE